MTGRCMSGTAMLAAALLALATSVVGELEPPADVSAMDTPSDAGRSVTVTWAGVQDADPPSQYEVLVSIRPSGPFRLAQRLDGTTNPMSEEPVLFGRGAGTDRYHYVHIKAYTDGAGEKVPLENGKEYYFRVDARYGDRLIPGKAVVAATPAGDLFNQAKLNNLVLAITFCGIILFSIHLAKRRDLYIRRIAGLEAMDEALGRATEMGKAVLFVHGLREMSYISTIAAVNILSRVARRTAELDTILRVSNYDPVVMSVSQETVKASYLEAGRPDAYDPDSIFIAGTDQFSYAAAVEGIMVREKPAAHIMMGYFYAESLLLAETGSTTGAIQIAGTDAFTQLPFFVTTCDYTLLGEELYAASAYLSREPKLLGSLKGQDAGKAILILVIVLGTLLATIGYPHLARLFSAY